jgi:3D (Asp-Asp-Asp) domain-containing protein
MWFLTYFHVITQQNDFIVKESVFSSVSCYNSEIGQTDSDPTTMANGQQVFDGAVANNYYPFGTRVIIGGRTYVVSDRMNRRYGKNYFDIYFPDYRECVNFGRKKLNVIVDN